MLRQTLSSLSRKSGTSALISKPLFRSSTKTSPGSNNPKSKFDDMHYKTRFGGPSSRGSGVRTNAPNGPGTPGKKKGMRVANEAIRQSTLDIGSGSGRSGSRSVSVVPNDDGGSLALASVLSSSDEEPDDPLEDARYKAIVEGLIYGVSPEQASARIEASTKTITNSTLETIERDIRKQVSALVKAADDDDDEDDATATTTKETRLAKAYKKVDLDVSRAMRCRAILQDRRAAAAARASSSEEDKEEQERSIVSQVAYVMDLLRGVLVDDKDKDADTDKTTTKTNKKTNKSEAAASSESDAKPMPLNRLGPYTFVSVLKLSEVRHRPGKAAAAAKNAAAADAPSSSSSNASKVRVLECYKLLKLFSSGNEAAASSSSSSSSSSAAAAALVSHSRNLLSNPFVISSLVSLHCSSASCSSSDPYLGAVSRFRDLSSTYLSLQPRPSPPVGRKGDTYKGTAYGPSTKRKYNELLSPLLPSYTTVLQHLVKVAYDEVAYPSSAMRDDACKEALKIHQEMMLLDIGPIDEMVQSVVMKLHFKGGNVEKGLEIFETIPTATGGGGGTDTTGTGSFGAGIYADCLKGIARAYGIDRRYDRPATIEGGHKARKIYFARLTRRVLDKLEGDDHKNLILAGGVAAANMLDGKQKQKQIGGEMFWGALAGLCGALGDFRGAEAVYKAKAMYMGADTHVISKRLAGRGAATATGGKAADSTTTTDMMSAAGALSLTDLPPASGDFDLDSIDSAGLDMSVLNAVDYSTLLSAYARSMDKGNVGWAGLDNDGLLSTKLTLLHKLPKALSPPAPLETIDETSVHGLTGVEAGIANLKWDEWDEQQSKRGRLKRVKFDGIDGDENMGTGRWEMAVQPPISEQLFGLDDPTGEGMKRFQRVEAAKMLVGDESAMPSMLEMLEKYEGKLALPDGAASTKTKAISSGKSGSLVRGSAAVAMKDVEGFAAKGKQEVREQGFGDDGDDEIDEKEIQKMFHGESDIESLDKHGDYQDFLRLIEQKALAVRQGQLEEYEEGENGLRRGVGQKATRGGGKGGEGEGEGELVFKTPSEKLAALMEDHANSIVLCPVIDVITCLREPLPDDYSYHDIRNLNFQSAMATVDHAIATGSCDVSVMNAGLAAVCASGRLRVALDMYDNKFGAAGLSPDSRSERILVETLCESKRGDLALKFKDDVQKSKKRNVDVISYGHMVRLFANKGDEETALSLLAECAAVHGGVVPTSFYVKSLRILCQKLKYMSADGKVTVQANDRESKFTVMKRGGTETNAKSGETAAAEVVAAAAAAAASEEERVRGARSMTLVKYPMKKSSDIALAVSLIPKDPALWLKRGQGKELMRDKGVAWSKKTLPIRNAVL